MAQKTQYDNKQVISTKNLVDTTWLARYHRPMEITHDQGLEFIGHDFIKNQIEEEYGIAPKPSTLANPTSNERLEWIHTVLGNLVRAYNIKDTYIDDNKPWLGI